MVEVQGMARARKALAGAWALNPVELSVLVSVWPCSHFPTGLHRQVWLVIVASARRSCVRFHLLPLRQDLINFPARK